MSAPARAISPMLSTFTPPSISSRLGRPVRSIAASTSLRAARKLVDAAIARTGREILLEVDGGVKVDNIAEIGRAGADTFVAGSAIFRSSDYRATIGAMRAALAQSRD